MDSTERVMAALSFRQPDVVPRFEGFWPEFVDAWRTARRADGAPEAAGVGGAEGDPERHYGIDICIAVADETPWPSGETVLSREDGVMVRRDTWGKLIRERAGAKFFEEIAVALPQRADADGLQFESPALDARYEGFLRRIAAVRARPDPPCIFAKVGGPYLRTSNLRGIEQWLIDIAEDPSFAAALASRVTDHIIQVGIESLRRADLYDTGIWIYDDIAYNDGVMVGPVTYERIFLPLMQRMIAAFKAAGARTVIMHSDGNILSVLDGLLDAGLDGINPVEPKAGMDALALRERYGDRLALIGGIDNAHILPRGTDEDVRRHVLRVLAAGRDGGLVIGSHSIGPDVSPARYEYYSALIRDYGRYPLHLDEIADRSERVQVVRT